jgi:hypothetical protein
MRKSILLFVIILFAAGCSKVTSVASTDESTDGYKTFNGEDFTFIYPKSWVKSDVNSTGADKSITSGIKVMFIDPSANGNFRDNLNVEVTQSPALAPSAEYTANLTSDKMTLNGNVYGIRNYKKIDFHTDKRGQLNIGLLTAEYEIAQNGTKVVFSDCIIPSGTKTYILTFITTKDRYETIKDTTIKKVIDSFNVK